MVASGVVMEETAVSSIELIQAIKNVLGSMTVDQIQVDCKSQTMSFIDQSLELLGSSIAALNKKKNYVI